MSFNDLGGGGDFGGDFGGGDFDAGGGFDGGYDDGGYDGGYDDGGYDGGYDDGGYDGGYDGGGYDGGYDGGDFGGGRDYADYGRENFDHDYDSGPSEADLERERQRAEQARLDSTTDFDLQNNRTAATDSGQMGPTIENAAAQSASGEFSYYQPSDFDFGSGNNNSLDSGLGSRYENSDVSYGPRNNLGLNHSSSELGGGVQADHFEYSNGEKVVKFDFPGGTQTCIAGPETSLKTEVTVNSDGNTLIRTTIEQPVGSFSGQVETQKMVSTVGIDSTGQRLGSISDGEFKAGLGVNRNNDFFKGEFSSKGLPGTSDRSSPAIERSISRGNGFAHCRVDFEESTPAQRPERMRQIDGARRQQQSTPEKLETIEIHSTDTSGAESRISIEMSGNNRPERGLGSSWEPMPQERGFPEYPDEFDPSPPPLASGRLDSPDILTDIAFDTVVTVAIFAVAGPVGAAAYGAFALAKNAPGIVAGIGKGIIGKGAPAIGSVLIRKSIQKGPYYAGKIWTSKSLKKMGAKRIRNDVRNVKSVKFKDFIRKEKGASFKQNEWKKHMETWRLRDGTTVENHYWLNKQTQEAFHHK